MFNPNDRFDRSLIVAALLCWALIGATVVYLAANIALNLGWGCPPGDTAFLGPAAHLSFMPLGVTCSYQLAHADGRVTTRPSAFPEVTILASAAFLIMIHRLRRAGG